MIGIVSENLNFLEKYNIDGNSTCVFFDGYIPPLLIPNVCKFSKSSIFEFEGPIVSTCLESTKTMLKTSMASKKFYLIESPEWAAYSRFNYKDLADIFLFSDVKIVALNKQIYEVLKNMFREPDLLMEDFNLELLESI
tara:strand:+ start:198 stop:611 length:414 start_codon:yes stop_codon:yes gene_type:complete